MAFAKRWELALHLVTGGSGFVGSNIARLLRDRGEAVRVLDLWKDDTQSADIEFVEADINDREKVAIGAAPQKMLPAASFGWSLTPARRLRVHQLTAKRVAPGPRGCTNSTRY